MRTSRRQNVKETSKRQNVKTVCTVALIVTCAVTGIGVLAHAQQPRRLKPAALRAVPAEQPPVTQAESQPAVRFDAVDIYIDAGDEPLAAYQFELTAETGAFKVVGVEGGEHPAFAEKPPYYDPAALNQGRIIIAAFNTGDDLPNGKARVARVHVQIVGNQDPQYNVQLRVAATVDGEEISAAASWEPATVEVEAKGD